MESAKRYCLAGFQLPSVPMLTVLLIWLHICPRQLEAGNPGGCEATIYLAKHFLEFTEPNYIVVKLDYSNLSTALIGGTWWRQLRTSCLSLDFGICTVIYLFFTMVHTQSGQKKRPVGPTAVQQHSSYVVLIPESGLSSRLPWLLHTS